jgi:hypothetical protein
MEDGTYQVTVVQNGTTIVADNMTVSLGGRADKTFDLRNPATSAGVVSPANKAQKELSKGECWNARRIQRGTGRPGLKELRRSDQTVVPGCGKTTANTHDLRPPG